MAVSFSRWASALALAVAAAVAVSCGGGGGGGGTGASPAVSPAPQASSAGSVARVIVAGDSLADVGTFGLKATVQNAANPAAGYPIYPELVASQLGAGRLCNFFSSTDGKVFTTNTGCTDFAVAAALVRNPITRGGSGGPFSLQFQLERAVDASGGRWQGGDLIVVDAGGNDAAALADAYVDARTGGTTQRATYLALLAQELDASTIADALAQPNGGAVAAGLYMQKLARTYWDTVKANTLDKGATRVALLNVPDISRTPRLRSMAAALAAAEGSAEGAAFQAALSQWISGFNAELARLVAGEPRVALVTYFEDFNVQAANPGAFGLTNITDPSCPPEGGFPACTDAALDASPPAGLGPGWWRSWYFSDEFHPSPHGHELLADIVMHAIARAGWR